MTYRNETNHDWKTKALLASALVVAGTTAGYIAIDNATDNAVAAAVTETTDTIELMGGGGRGGRHNQLEGDAPDVELVPTQQAGLAAESVAEDGETPDAEPLIIDGAQYMDGQYYGESVRADRWGNMQVVAIIEEGELVDIQIADYPRNTYQSDLITRNALPSLISEAIEVQSADIDIVTRATDSSIAFIESLESALDEAAVINETTLEETPEIGVTA